MWLNLNMTTHRTADHLAHTHNGTTVHAASDLASASGRHMHVLACTGRTVSAAAWTGSPSAVTCNACRKGLNNGRIEWVWA